MRFLSHKKLCYIVPLIVEISVLYCCFKVLDIPGCILVYYYKLCCIHHFVL